MTNQEFSWTGKYVGTLDGGKDLSADSFFTKTDYRRLDFWLDTIISSLAKRHTNFCFLSGTGC